MSVDNLEELFVEELRDLLSAEKQLVKALPKMAKAATSADLKKGFQDHLAQTETHVERLEKVFELLGKTARAKTCEAMKGLIKEGDELAHEDAADEVKDAALIAAAQKVEHYEIASYGTMITWANQLGLDSAVKLLGQTLEEEKETDQKLTDLAESKINASAA